MQGSRQQEKFNYRQRQPLVTTNKLDARQYLFKQDLQALVNELGIEI